MGGAVATFVQEISKHAGGDLSKLSGSRMA